MAVSAGSVLRCRDCRGRFVDDSALVKLVAPDAASAIRVVGGSIGHLACPRCGATMTAHRRSGVTIDRCAESHGTWFDADEVDHFAEGIDFHRERRDTSALGDEPEFWTVIRRLLRLM